MYTRTILTIFQCRITNNSNSNNKSDDADPPAINIASLPLPSDIKGNELKEVSYEHHVFHQNGIGLFINKLLTDAEKLLALSEWVPDKNYKCSTAISAPSEKKSTRFVAEWFVKISWLAYSKLKEGTSCNFFVVFAKEMTGKGCNQ